MTTIEIGEWLHQAGFLASPSEQEGEVTITHRDYPEFKMLVRLEELTIGKVLAEFWTTALTEYREGCYDAAVPR